MGIEEIISIHLPQCIGTATIGNGLKAYIPEDCALIKYYIVKERIYAVFFNSYPPSMPKSNGNGLLESPFIFVPKEARYVDFRGGSLLFYKN